MSKELEMSSSHHFEFFKKYAQKGSKMKNLKMIEATTIPNPLKTTTKYFCNIKGLKKNSGGCVVEEKLKSCSSKVTMPF